MIVSFPGDVLRSLGHAVANNLLHIAVTQNACKTATEFSVSRTETDPCDEAHREVLLLF